MKRVSPKQQLFDKIESIADPDLLWVVKHACDLATDLMPRKAAVYKNSWRKLGPRGMFAHIDRKLQRITIELWDGEKVTDNEPLTEVIDDVIVYLMKTRQLLEENPNDLSGKEYRRKVEMGK